MIIPCYTNGIYTYFSTSIYGDDRGMIYDCFNMFQPLGESILGLLGGELPTFESFLWVSSNLSYFSGLNLAPTKIPLITSPG